MAKYISEGFDAMEHLTEKMLLLDFDDPRYFQYEK